MSKLLDRLFASNNKDIITLAGNETTLQAAEGKDGKQPTVNGIAYNGGKLSVAYWEYPVVLDLQGMEIPENAVQLDVDHSDSVRDRIGSVTAKIADNRLEYSGKIISDNDAAQNIITHAKAGENWNVSIDARPVNENLIPTGETEEVNGQSLEGPFYLITESKLRKISVVTQGADMNSNMDVAAKHNHKENKPMETTEKERLENLRSIVKAYEGQVDTETVKTKHQEAVENKITANELELEFIRASRPAAGSNISTAPNPASSDETVQASLLLKSAPKTAETAFKGREYALEAASKSKLHMLDICAHALQESGKQAPRDKNELVQAAMSTDKLSGILRDTAERIIVDAYNRTPAAWRLFAHIKDLPDFREHTGIRPSQVGGVEEVAPGGELKHIEIDGDKYTVSANTYGGMMMIDRRDMINDDIGAYSQTASELGRACARKVNDLVALVLLATNADLTGADSALDDAALGSAVAALRNRTDANGDPIDLQPRALVVPPALERTARGLLESTEIQAAEGEPMGNVWRQLATLAVEPRIENEKFSGYSAKKWYLAASPEDQPVIVGFVGGRQTPFVEELGLQQSGANRLALTWRTYIDAGVSLGDTKAIVASDGE